MPRTATRRKASQGQSTPSRPVTRSRKGCPECRRRKIKCDERQPQCGQCQKTDRQCHLQDSIFKPHSLSVDNQPANVGQLQSGGSANREGFILSSPRPQRRPSGTSLDRVPVSNPSLGILPLNREAAGVEEIDCHHAVSPGVDEGPSYGTLATDAVPSYLASPNLIAGDCTIESLKGTQEELFLLRHYSECIAPWMDLLYRYEVFSREVLTLARDHPILRYAACAVAAKQLGQMREPLSTVLRGKTQERIAAQIAHGQLGFVWYGIKYYEKAIQTLVKSITRDSQATETNQASPAVSLSQGELMIRADAEDPIVRILGTCILIQYEHLSANRDAWSGHLTGFAKLLDLIDSGMLLERAPIYEQVYPWTKDIMEVKAGFWNFVVNDLEESLVANRRTRIDTENLALWRNMGLLIEDDGRMTLDLFPSSLSTTAEHARDKVRSYTLIRLLCKLVDYLAPNPRRVVSPATSNPSAGVSDFTLLQNHFDGWFQMLSPTFHPDGTFFSGTHSSLFEDEIWFSNDLCATTMMYYHMARLLLLIHQPTASPSNSQSSETGAVFDVLKAFRDTEKKLRIHAAKIASIVRGTPCDAVKLRAIQPLYIAGRCCNSHEDRKSLLFTLTSIQDSLGVATGYRVTALLQEWGQSYQDYGMEARLTAEEQYG